MWPVIIVFVLVLGYYFIQNDLESKDKFKRAQGWSAYFQVALKGSEFVLFGIFLTVLFEIGMYGLMYILNIVSYFISDHIFTFADDFNNLRFKTFSAFSWCVALLTFVVGIGLASEAKKRSGDQKASQDAIERIWQKDTIKKLQLEAIEKDLFVMVTLKSRKVYVGIVDSEKIKNADTHSDEFLSVIPILSGYRDKQTLDFVETKNYGLVYSDHGIGVDSHPLSLQQFRHVINLAEVECLSLFDMNIYASFSVHSSRTETP